MSTSLETQCREKPDLRPFVYPLLARLAAYSDDYQRRLILEMAGNDLAEAGTQEAEDILDLVVKLVADEKKSPAKILAGILAAVEG